jgi:hypothetical protein
MERDVATTSPHLPGPPACSLTVCATGQTEVFTEDTADRLIYAAVSDFRTSFYWTRTCWAPSSGNAAFCKAVGFERVVKAAFLAPRTQASGSPFATEICTTETPPPARIEGPGVPSRARSALAAGRSDISLWVAALVHSRSRRKLAGSPICSGAFPAFHMTRWARSSTAAMLCTLWTSSPQSHWP